MKKVKLFLAILCIIAMMPATLALADTGYEYDETAVKSSVEALVDKLVKMNETELEYYVENSVGWTKTSTEALLSYQENDTLGAYVSSDDIKIKEDGKMLILTQLVHFEKCDLEATVTMADIDGNVSVIDVAFKTIDTSNKTLGEKMATAAFNSLIGIISVFIVLILISSIISLFKFIPRIQEAFSRRKSGSAEAVFENAIAQIEEKQERGEDTELVAVITAAICASTGASSDSFVVRSIKKVNRRKR